MDDAIADLQVRLTYQEDDLKQFNGILTQQQRELDELREQVAYLKDLLTRLAPSQVGDVEDEPLPPHY